MTSEEILQALQVGKISLEDAKKALTVGATLLLRSSGLSADPVSGQRSDIASSAASSEREPVVSSGAIAIVGMSGQYPDAHNLTDFWDNLVQGKNAIREIPLSRFDVSDYYDPDPAQKGKIYCKGLGVLDEIEYFDPLFFHISPAEAEAMDPQQRLFLEEGYKAFEDAGYSPQLLSNRKCGVYLGIGSHEYGLLLSEQKASEADLLGTNSAIAAARLAYLLNLKGPAIAIDTACSSSLVATHLACQALRTQEIDMALVGGVSLCLTPGFYVRMCNAWMLSPDGQCKTFDASANGFVPGEGVGVLVLKRLADAEADHDQIYGLIIASGMNQDGTTSGITAPSMKSQIELEREIYQKYQIDPASISYVEMHGTGTKLGDPIELEALSTVFQEKTQRKQYCAIGSVKTNIGHTLAAAGVAGVQKVLLAMQQKKLVPTLHFQQPNEHFDFATSPFYVNTEVQDWKSETGMPRRAAVSSFGFSGTNAHVVIEEYIPRRDADGGQPQASGPHPLETPVLFVLSAKSEQQLKRYAQELKLWIQAHEQLALQDIAFTLQLGREAMDYRLAIVADSREILLQRLEQFLVDNQVPTEVYFAHAKKGTHDAALFDGDEDGQSLLHIWCQKKNLAKIAQVWVKGVNVNWNFLYTVDAGYTQNTEHVGTGLAPVRIPAGYTQNTEHVGTGLAPVRLPTPHRISLPTYPFARERYWIPAATEETRQGRADRGRTGASPIRPQSLRVPARHPLVQRNISTLWEQRFSSTFHGNEFFLADHVIKGQRIMPGVVYLEMARAAVREAIGANTGLPHEKSHLQLSHVVWLRPLIVGELPVTVHITLVSVPSSGSRKAIDSCCLPTGEAYTPKPNESSGNALETQSDETITFVVSHEEQEGETRAQIYCQGTASVEKTQDRRRAPDRDQPYPSLHNTVPNVDLASVQARCQIQISATECYQRYSEMGISYGHTLQGIEQLSVGEDEVLARLRLPVGADRAGSYPVPCADPGTQTHTDFVLHPSLLDAALQACIGLLMEQPEFQEPHLPFALEELSIEGEVPAQGWAWVRRHPRPAGTELAPVHVPASVFDIEVFDDAGRVAVRLHGLTIRPLSVHEEEARTVLLTPVWQEETIARPNLTEADFLSTSQLVLLCDLPRILASHIQTHMASGGHCHSLVSSQSRREQRFQDLVVQLIGELQQLLRSRPAVLPLVQVVVTYRQEPSLLEALSGVLKTAQQEYPELRGQLIEVEGEPEAGELLAYLRENQRCPHQPHIRYRDGKRWVREWQEYPEVASLPKMPWKEGGCYLITGGTGGLARRFVQEIARQVQEATIIPVGRSVPTASQRAQLDDLTIVQGSAGGIRIDYQQADVSDGSDVHTLIQRVLQKSGHLDGIIHAAGVLRDSLLLNKTPEEIGEVLAPKVIGVELLDEASSQIPLDFFLLCSSVTAVMGNVGQADYAGANAYLDAFAHARQALVRAGKRQGTTLSINWPFWEEGGMQIEAEIVQMMRTRMGIEPLGTEIGMRTFYQALASGLAQVMMAHGQVGRIKQQLLGRSEPKVGAVPRERAKLLSGDKPQSQKISRDKLREALAHMVSRVLKVRVEEIDAETPLPEYGFDSITFTQLANRLNQTYQLDLTPALFFEHSTLERLAQHLQGNYPAILAPHFAEASGTTSELVPANPLGEPEKRSATSPLPRRRTRLAQQSIQQSVPPPSPRTEPIAIIGISGCFPQSPDLQSLWSNLLAGRDCMSEMPQERWDWQSYFGDPATSQVKWAGVIEETELFDPLFFGISPREAEQMDPQQRLLMMYVWKAIEDAGYAAESLSGSDTALFVGTMNSGYSERVSRARMSIEGYSSTSQVGSVGPNRMSYFLNLHGPSEPIETACSSSLVAIHRGANAIESGQCSMAIVGGVNTLVSPELHISFSKAGMLSSDGRCKPFSAQANGYVRGEGVGMLVLKKLSDAEQDGDHIYGVIRASAENHGGRAASLTAPNPRAQADVLIAAYRKARIDPRTVGYIEAHGTGTELGDPIEINGIKTAWSELALQTGARHSPYGDATGAYGEGPVSQASCGIGSVKSNIGHLELAAGVAGVIKVLLQMQHKTLVKSLHCEQINPYIQLEDSPFYIVQENREWEALRDRVGNVWPRRAGVSSFGFGGTNAHVVLEEYVPKPIVARSGSSAVGDPSLLIMLSAKNEERLHEQVRQLLDWLTTGGLASACSMCAEESLWLQDLAYTLQVGREVMEERLALQVSGLSDLEEKLRRYLSASTHEGGDRYCGRVKRQDTISLFSADEDGQMAVAAWMSKGKYGKLLEFWVKGGTIDWKHLYGAHLPHRISLPTYPFARERYWLPTPTVGTMPCACPLPTESLKTGVTSPRGSVPPQPSGASPLALPQPLVLRPLANGPVIETKQESRIVSPAPALALPAADPELVPRLEEELVRSLAQTLIMEQSAIDVEKPFVEMGLDSVIGVEWIQSLNKQYACNLAVSCVYDYPTIRQLAGFLQKELSKHGGGIQQTPVQYPQAGQGQALSATTYQRVIVKGSGGIDDLIISEAELPELKDNEVRIAVRAFSLNFGDLLCVKGLYPTMPPYPFTPGFETSGVVLDVGRAVTTFQPGDPVIALAGATLGGQASAMTSLEEHVFHKPAVLSFEEACALPVAAITMVAAFEKACLKRGEKILIHTATGGTGLIAIQLANYYGAQIYASAGSQAKLDYLKQLGVPHRINYRETDFEQEIEHLTEGQGIDVVINTLSGDAIQKGMNCLASGGRYIEIAMTALKSARTIDLSVLSHNQSFYSVDLRKLALTDPATLRYYCHEMFRLVKEGIITPTICQIFDWERLKEAYRYMEDRQHIGKIVVRIPETIQVSLRDFEQRIATKDAPHVKHVSSEASRQKEAIAIVGMSGKYPDAHDLTDFWDNLVQGKNAIREIPLSRFDVSDYYDPDPRNGKIYCKRLGVLNEIEYFDPLFFHLSPAEAERMDPQQRLFLEEGYKAFEDAGYSPQLLSNRKCGVYLAIASHEYHSLLLSEQKVAEADLLGTNSAIAAARLAYLLNLKGPAIAIDTACSSSLVATHLACQALWNQETNMALVGGVSLCLTPDFYVRLCRAGMLSPDGQCKTFDTSANGFVPGEGVGALVLKRLADAEADHDQIYGLIIASGMNQDGATNGMTAPSVKSQIDLEREIYGNSQIDPASISYVEMHGTGTKLGDPIELDALSTVFQEKTQRKQYCAIGSVKTNIGHTLMAAGLAGVQKVLLAMQQKKLVPSLHFQQPNEHFDFEASPFYVNTEVQDWNTAEAGVPRRAAVSSFGFSGTNAHLVLEEYIPRQDADAGQPQASGPRPLETPVVFVLSAKSEQQLKGYAQEMKLWIQAHEELVLQNIAFTLQLGREVMDYRLAIVADSREILLQRLEQFLVDNQASTGVHTAHAKKGMPDTTLFEDDEDGQSLLHIWCQKKNLTKIAQVWVKGVNVDWKLLYTFALPYRVSLPTYPFARERYWLPIKTHVGTVPRACPMATPTHSAMTNRAEPPEEPRIQAAALHPLVQSNTSTLWEQRFSSTFRADEFFLADHVVKGQRIMPGVAHLEMARTAVALACGYGPAPTQVPQVGVDAPQEPSYLRLSQIVWSRPLICDPAHPVTVHIVLEAQENGTIAFFIAPESEQARRDNALRLSEGTDAQIYSQGIAEWYSQSEARLITSQSLDLPAVQARCQRQISVTECYQRFRSLGFSYGPAFLGIEELSIGEDEGLARLRLPVAVAQTHAAGGEPLPYVLHPSVLDAALQGCLWLVAAPNGTTEKLQVPFALSEISIVSEVPAQSWAWVRRRQSSAAGQVFDMDLCDDTGRLVVQVRGLSTRQLLTEEETRTILLTLNWKEDAITSLHLLEEAPLPAEPLAPLASNPLVLLCDFPSALAERIQAQMASGGHCRNLPVGTRTGTVGTRTGTVGTRTGTVGTQTGTVGTRTGASPVPTRVPKIPVRQLRREQHFQEAVVQLIQELEHLLQSKPAGSVLVQVVVAHREEPSFLEALAGVLKTAQQEYPKLRGQLIEVEGEPEEEALLGWLRENQQSPHDSHIRYRGGKRWVREWQELQEVSAPTNVPWKEGGCYLISGGAGGLARLFVQEIARQVQEATIILVGRSALSTSQHAQLDDVAAVQHPAGGIRIDYQQVDVTDGTAVHALIQCILQQYGHLDGIIHAAGVLRDSLLLNKTPEEVQAVLAPKVMGVEYLDEASRQIPLDFFILCSSLAAVVGNVGQADYAAANAYLDAFAHARQTLVQVGERQGKTVSINWPLWEEGGMQIEAGTRQMMLGRLGMEVMGTKIGMKTLYQALACGRAQVMVAHGRVERIKQRLLHRFPDSLVKAVPEPLVTDSSHEDGQAQGTVPTGILSGQAQGTIPTDALREALAHTVSRMLKIRVEKINAQTPLSEYGFDSTSFTEFANRLNQSYQLDLTPPIFYEHSTIESLAQHLQTAYATVLASHFATVSPVAPGLAPQQVVSESMTTDKVSSVVPIFRRRPRVSPLPMQVPEQQAYAGSLPIAIVGMSGSFPLAPDIESFWNNLLSGRDCISEIPPSRWDWHAYFGNPATEANKTNVKWAGVMEGVEMFDPLFFGISPREAEQMDPLQRLLMMYVWKAIEDAGYAPSSLSGTNTAMFVGTMNSGYGNRVFGTNIAIEGYSSTGQAPSVGPNRISYFLNLHGPSEPIETACSSSLVAIHRGVNAIESGQSTMAIVGGVNILVSPEVHISFSKAGMLCEDGRSKPFSAQANGYVRGEGVGMLVLKKLSDAERDGDHIYAIIRASAENHGGRATSLTAPNPKAQADLLVTAYSKAGIDPWTVGYIEAHGTGTALGDPIEINGLKTAWSSLAQRTGTRHSPYGEEPVPQASCGIGSVKSNIGHLELAAGVAGVIKVLLQLQHKTLVKSMHCEQINPYIQLENSPFYIVQENREWETLQDRAGNTLPRRAGVSSFSFGGANAHVVLEEYVSKPKVARSPVLAPSLLIVFSAKNEERLHEQVRQLLDWLAIGGLDTACPICTEESLRLQDLAYTLQVGREAMEERLALQVSDLSDLSEKLRSYLSASTDEDGDWYCGRVKRQDTISLFSADEDGQMTIAAWMSKGKYGKLLEFWVKGGTIDWKHLYGEYLPHRISLPTYPFARERYWLPAPTVGTMPCACPLPTESLKTGVTSTRESVSPRSPGASPSSLPQPLTLRPLADGPVRSHGDTDTHHRDKPLSAPTDGTNPETEEYLPLVEAGQEPRIVPPFPAPALPAADPGLVPRLEEELVRSLAQVLAMEPRNIDAETPFIEMGVDSIVGVEWIQRLNKQYSLSLPVTKLYDYTTIHALAGLLAKEGNISGGRLHPQELTQIMDTEAPLTSELHLPELPEKPVSRVPLQEEETSRESEPEANSVVAMYEIEPGIIQITMQDRVHKNTFSTELVDGLIKAFHAIEASSSYKVVILTGYDNYFASGGTKEGLLAIQEGKLKFTDAKIYNLALDCKVPVIAAMQGHAIGAGWSLGMFCDIIVMSRESYYASNYVKYGFTPGAGATLIFPEKLGASLAQEVLYTGKQFQGSDLEVKGVSFTFCPRKDVLPNALQLAQELAQAPREALIAIKELLAKSIRERVSAAYDSEVAMHERTFVNQPEVKERIEARFGSISKNAGNKTTVQVSTDKENTHQETGPILPRQNAIAIIGMSGRYPDANNLSEYWDNLVKAKNTIREIPLSRLDISDRYDPDPTAFGKIYCKWLGALEDIEYFDSLFFHISPVEAEGMDPQHRLFLEEGYKALEDAGYSPGLLSNKKCGIYLGIIGHEYGILLSQQKVAGMNLFGISPAIAAARLAYLLNLKGPAMPIDTACSSSLVATHLACQALRSQEIDMALVGGVSLCLTPDFYASMCSAGMLSPSGQCKTFDASADGFVPGEGVGALVLKRLADAEADHDQIYGVIIGSGINQDGATNGMTAPSVKSQIDLEREIYQKYAIDPESISYVEMHGTGTKLGDPIELEALSTVFRESTRREQYCAIGSVKSNIGHTLAAAGVAGVHKILLAMQQKKLVPSLHFQQPNEYFNFAASPFYVNTEVQDWKSEVGIPRRAAVSSFGFSGTNAHVVIEEYIPYRDAGGGPPHASSPRPPETPILFVLSAKSEQQLKSYAQNMQLWLQAANEELALEDIAFTLQVGREAMDYRLAILADSREVLQQRLAGFVDNQTSTGVYTAQVKKNSLGTGSPSSDVTLFEADEDGQSLLHTWFQKKKLEKIAQVWVKGLNVDWMLLYGSAQGTIPTEAGQVQDTKSEPRMGLVQSSIPALPHRVSLPTYPFAHKRHWVPAPTAVQPLTPISNPLSEIISVPSSGSRKDIDSHRLLGGGVYTPNPNESSGDAVGTVGIVQTRGARHTGYSTDPATTSRVVLRPVGIVPCADPAQPRSSITLSATDQRLSQSSNNDDLALERPMEQGQGTQTTASGVMGKNPDAAQSAPMVQGTQATAVFPQLEEELARSLAEALCMEPDDIDVEKPFGEIGLDSVIGVEWIKSINKQYACNLKASSVYDHPTIRQLAGFLEKELSKHEGAIQQMPVQSMLSLSLDDLLRQVQQRNLEPEKAEQLLNQLFLQNNNSKSGAL